jgi:hypothetical protein
MGNDDDEDFIPFIRNRWHIGEDYYDSADEDDDPDYDPNEHICKGTIVN